MKKLWLVPILALTLAACGNTEDDAMNEDDIEVETVEPEEDAVEEDSIEEVETEDEDEQEDIEEDVEENDTDDESVASDSDLAEYEEAALLEEHIPVNELTYRVETDNQGTRVLLFENASGEKVYKSIFVKNDEHLKIIDLKGDGLVFEGHL